MPATTISSEDVTFGMSAETAIGMIVSSFSSNISSDKAQIVNHEGDIVTVAYYNKKATLTASGALISNSITLKPGDAVLFANASVGEVTGTVVIDTITESQSVDGFIQLEIAATQYSEELA